VAAGLAVHPIGAEKILDAERHAFQRACLAARQALVGCLRHVARLVGRK
jgi:hypothetical protein